MIFQTTSSMQLQPQLTIKPDERGCPPTILDILQGPLLSISTGHVYHRTAKMLA